jgi:acyl carrier protein
VPQDNATPSIESIKNVLKVVSNLDVTNISAETDLFETGIIDSFGMIELLSGLEKYFSINFEEHYLVPQNFWTLYSILETVNKVISDGSTR